MSAPSPLPGVAPLAPSQWKNPNPMSSYINPVTNDLYHNDAPGPDNEKLFTAAQLRAAGQMNPKQFNEHGPALFPGIGGGQQRGSILPPFQRPQTPILPQLPSYPAAAASDALDSPTEVIPPYHADFSPEQFHMGPLSQIGQAGGAPMAQVPDGQRMVPPQYAARSSLSRQVPGASPFADPQAKSPMPEQGVLGAGLNPFLSLGANSLGPPPVPEFPRQPSPAPQAPAQASYNPRIAVPAGNGTTVYTSPEMANSHARGPGAYINGRYVGPQIGGIGVPAGRPGVPAQAAVSTANGGGGQSGVPGAGVPGGHRMTPEQQQYLDEQELSISRERELARHQAAVPATNRPFPQLDYGPTQPALSPVQQQYADNPPQYGSQYWQGGEQPPFNMQPTMQPLATAPGAGVPRPMVAPALTQIAGINRPQEIARQQEALGHHVTDADLGRAAYDVPDSSLGQTQANAGLGYVGRTMQPAPAMGAQEAYEARNLARTPFLPNLNVGLPRTMPQEPAHPGMWYGDNVAVDPDLIRHAMGLPPAGVPAAVPPAPTPGLPAAGGAQVPAGSQVAGRAQGDVRMLKAQPAPGVPQPAPGVQRWHDWSPENRALLNKAAPPIVPGGAIKAIEAANIRGAQRRAEVNANYQAALIAKAERAAAQQRINGIPANERARFMESEARLAQEARQHADQMGLANRKMTLDEKMLPTTRLDSMVQAYITKNGSPPVGHDMDLLRQAAGQGEQSPSPLPPGVPMPAGKTPQDAGGQVPNFRNEIDAFSDQNRLGPNPDSTKVLDYLRSKYSDVSDPKQVEAMKKELARRMISVDTIRAYRDLHDKGWKNTQSKDPDIRKYGQNFDGGIDPALRQHINAMKFAETLLGGDAQQPVPRVGFFGQ